MRFAALADNFRTLQESSGKKSRATKFLRNGNSELNYRKKIVNASDKTLSLLLLPGDAGDRAPADISLTNQSPAIAFSFNSV
jgi:hypothetical protein